MIYENVNDTLHTLAVVSYPTILTITKVDTSTFNILNRPEIYDLATNMTKTVIFSDQCAYLSELSVSPGPVIEDMSVTITVSCIPDGTIWDSPAPPMAALISTTLSDVQDVVNAHVSHPRFNIRPELSLANGRTWRNSYDWWISGEALYDLTIPHGSIAAKFSISGLPGIIYFEDTNSIDWVIDPILFDTKSKASDTVAGSRDITLYCTIIDVLGKMSSIVSYTLTVAGPYSRFYPAGGVLSQRRNHRYRGPRESYKQLAFENETNQSLVTLNATGDLFAENISTTATYFTDNNKAMATTIRHIELQRGKSWRSV